MVKDGTLIALASVTDSSQEKFQKYYDDVMPYLKVILVNVTDKSNRILHAKAMECISLVRVAIGKDKFRDDTKQDPGSQVRRGGDPEVERARTSKPNSGIHQRAEPNPFPE